MDERVVTSEKCWNGVEEKMPEISREVKRMNLVENLTCLNAFEGKIWKRNQKVVVVGKIYQNGVMDGKIGKKERDGCQN